MSSPRSAILAHPALVLTFGEPAPGGLAHALRSALRETFAGAVGMRLRDLGDLRLAGVLGPDDRPQDPFRLRRWIAAEVRAAAEAHDGCPPGDPVLPVFLVVEGGDPVNRERVLAALAPAREGIRDAALPASLQPRLVPVVAGAPGGTAGAPGEEGWLLRVVKQACDHFDTLLLVAASGCRVGEDEFPRVLSVSERNRLLREQVVLLLSGGLLERIIAFRRGLSRAHVTVLASGGADEDRPWFPAPELRAFRWSAGVGNWAIHPQGASPAGEDAVEAHVSAAGRVWCRYAAPPAEPAAAQPVSTPFPELIP